MTERDGPHLIPSFRTRSPLYVQASSSPEVAMIAETPRWGVCLWEGRPACGTLGVLKTRRGGEDRPHVAVGEGLVPSRGRPRGPPLHGRQECLPHHHRKRGARDAAKITSQKGLIAQEIGA